MRTMGVDVNCGYLMAGRYAADGSWVPSMAAVPAAFWGRLKHEALRQHLADELKADEAAAKDGAKESAFLDSEQDLFRRWYLRLGFEVQPGQYPGDGLWPWTRGWTEERVDAYLQKPAAVAA